MVSKKPHLAHKKKGLSGREGLLAVVGLEVTTGGIRTGLHSKSTRKRVPDFNSCNANTAGAKCSADK